MPDEGRKNSMIDTEGNLGKRTVKTTLALLVVFVMVATAFAAVGYALQRSRADIMADVPLQWQKNVNAAIESGELPSDVTGAQVKDWLAAKMLTVSDKVKDSYVNPLNAKAVAEREAASASGSEPPAVAGTGKILVVLLEFAGSDTYKGVTYTGPMHNTIPQPPAENNVDYWMSDFAPSHYYDLLFGKKRGSLANYLKEQSGGLYTVDGYVTDWVQIKDHSQWYYGADTRTGGAGSDDLNGPVWRIAIRHVHPVVRLRHQRRRMDRQLDGHKGRAGAGARARMVHLGPQLVRQLARWVRNSPWPQGRLVHL
jgi:hypothetical protein